MLLQLFSLQTFNLICARTWPGAPAVFRHPQNPQLPFFTLYNAKVVNQPTYFSHVLCVRVLCAYHEFIKMLLAVSAAVKICVISHFEMILCAIISHGISFHISRIQNTRSTTYFWWKICSVPCRMDVHLFFCVQNYDSFPSFCMSTNTVGTFTRLVERLLWMGKTDDDKTH